ncbi:MAG: hypothetical protein J7647_13785 [Cyanobacteria bacterium SBLK]|nr:hypothetical protein [Cyanobacteria bacterium SBLK]
MPPRFSGVGGTWPVIDEVYDRSVIRQKSYLSCGSACGEMLLKSHGIIDITQDEIEAIAGAPTWVQWLAESLNQLQKHL